MGHINLKKAFLKLTQKDGQPLLLRAESVGYAIGNHNDSSCTKIRLANADDYYVRESWREIRNRLAQCSVKDFIVLGENGKSPTLARSQFFIAVFPYPRKEEEDTPSYKTMIKTSIGTWNLYTDETVEEVSEKLAALGPSAPIL